MLNLLLNYIVNMGEFVWNFLPIPKEIIYKFSFPWWNLNLGLTFVVRGELHNDWVIYVMSNWCIEFFEIQQLIRKDYVKL